MRGLVVEDSLDWMFIVMEFVEGGDLLDRLTTEPQAFDESLIRVLMFHISCALGYAHSQGVLHRDIKPENVLLCKDGFPKIADFGLSRTVTHQAVMTAVGTPSYAAPEVMHADSIYDFSADVYSVGRVLEDMFHPEACCAWVFPMLTPDDQKKFRKRWPQGSTPLQVTQALRQIQQRMVSQVPGERPSLFQVCQDIMKFAKENPLPHPFWGHETIMPQEPAKKLTVSPSEAAEIAGRKGYAVGLPVLVQAQGAWKPGVVEHISTTVCPGAVHVLFRTDEGKEHRVLILPWHFEVFLRPNPQGIAPTAGKGNGKGKGGQAKGQGKGKGQKGPAPDAEKQKCCCTIS